MTRNSRHTGAEFNTGSPEILVPRKKSARFTRVIGTANQGEYEFLPIVCLLATGAISNSADREMRFFTAVRHCARPGAFSFRSQHGAWVVLMNLRSWAIGMGRTASSSVRGTA